MKFILLSISMASITMVHAQTFKVKSYTNASIAGYPDLIDCLFYPVI